MNQFDTLLISGMAKCIRKLLFLFLFATASALALPGAVEKYDPTRDAVRDLEAAVTVAKREHKKILLDVGGDWCGDCRQLDRFLSEHGELTAERDLNYVWVKVYYGRENKNERLLSRFPKIGWYPTLLVLNEDGALIHVLDTRELLDGREFSQAKFERFLQQYAAKN